MRTPTAELASGIGAQTHIRTLFRARCAARQLYILVRARPGMMYVLSQMEPAEQDQWRLWLRLPPGTYRYRYYADLGGPVSYVSPAEVEDVENTMRRFDAVRRLEAVS